MGKEQQDMPQSGLEVFGTMEGGRASPQKVMAPGARRRSLPELEEIARADCALELYRMLGSSKILGRKGSRASCTGGRTGSSTTGTASAVSSSAQHALTSGSARKLAFANSISLSGAAELQQQQDAFCEAADEQPLQHHSSVSSALPVFMPVAQARQNHSVSATTSTQPAVDATATSEANSKLGTRNSVPLVVGGLVRPPGGSPTTSPNHRRASVATCGTYSANPQISTAREAKHDANGASTSCSWNCSSTAQGQATEDTAHSSNARLRHRTSVSKVLPDGQSRDSCAEGSRQQHDRSSCGGVGAGAAGSSSILLGLGTGTRSGRRSSISHRRSATGSDTLAALRAACDYLTTRASHSSGQSHLQHGLLHHHAAGSRDSAGSILAGASMVSSNNIPAAAGGTTARNAISMPLPPGLPSTPAPVETPVKHVCTGYHCSVCGVGAFTHACTGYNCPVCGVASVSATGHVCTGYNCEVCGVPAMSKKPTSAASVVAAMSAKLPSLPGGIDDDDSEAEVSQPQLSMTRGNVMAEDGLLRTGSSSQTALDQQLLSGYSYKTSKYSPYHSPASNSLNRSSNSCGTDPSTETVARNCFVDHVTDGADSAVDLDGRCNPSVLGSTKRNLAATMMRSPIKAGGSENRHLMSPCSKLGPGGLAGSAGGFSSSNSSRSASARKAADMLLDSDHDPDLAHVPVVAAIGCLPVRWLH